MSIAAPPALRSLHRLPRALAKALLAVAAYLACANGVFAQTPSPADFLKPDPAASCPPALRDDLNAIRPSDLAAHVRFLASRALGGRGLGSPGLEAAAEYVAASFRLTGLQPPSRIAPSYDQKVPLNRVSHPSGTLTIAPLTLVGGRACLLPHLAPQVISAPVVFAGYGVTERALGREDFRGLDLRGKAVLIYGTVPPGERWKKSDLKSRYAAEDFEDRYASRLEELGKAGAAMLIAIEDDLPKAIKAEKPGGPYFVSPERDEEDRVPALVRIGAADGRAILARAGRDASHPERLSCGALAGTRATLRIAGTIASVPGRNVIGVLEGSDSRLRDEAVIIGAHYDHLGSSDAKIYPGADDNASGVSALLTIARVMAASPHRPKRTIVFAAWTGEEAAHFGSRHYVRHPLWPLRRTTAYLNLDMIGHPWTTKEITQLVNDSGLADGKTFLADVRAEDFIEPGVAEQAAPDLAPVLAQAGSVTGLTLHVDRTSGRHGGSDYRSFALRGIPFIRFFGNFFPDYHKPGDTPERLDPAQMTRVARLACATLFMLADR